MQPYLFGVFFPYFLSYLTPHNNISFSNSKFRFLQNHLLQKLTVNFCLLWHRQIIDWLMLINNVFLIWIHNSSIVHIHEITLNFHVHFCLFTMKNVSPVDTRRRFNVDTTSYELTWKRRVYGVCFQNVLRHYYLLRFYQRNHKIKIINKISTLN